MTIERELKFQVDDPEALSSAAVREAFEGTGLRVEDAGTLRHADRYYDDPRLSLSRAGIALRRRIGGGKVVATFKTRGQVVGALHVREEIELPMEGRDWPEPIRDRVSRFADVPALKGRFELETERRRFVVQAEAGPVAEVSVDRVEASRPTGGRSVRFAEVEIEDRGGGAAALERVADRLRTLAPLTASDLTKLERAQRLLLGA